MALRTCSRCSTDKPTTDYYRNSNRPDGFFTYCKECHGKAGKQWRLSNPERFKALVKEAAIRNKEKRAKAHLSRKKAKRQQFNDYERARRARLRSVTVEEVDFTTVCQRDGWICHLCCGPVTDDPNLPRNLRPSLDHVVPLAKGGGHSYANVRLAHVGCNSAKGAR